MNTPKTTAKIEWSDEDGCFLAIDLERPGCCAVGDTVVEAYRELKDARLAWDLAKENAKMKADPKKCADCGCELDDEEDTYCEDCLYNEDDEEGDDFDVETEH